MHESRLMHVSKGILESSAGNKGEFPRSVESPLREHVVGTYDAAVLTRNEEGKVEIPYKRTGGSWDGRAHWQPRGRNLPLHSQDVRGETLGRARRP